MVISNYFSKAAASLPEQSGRDKASIYLHTLKVECPVSSEGSCLREVIQKVLVKMTTADATIRFSITILVHYIAVVQQRFSFIEKCEQEMGIANRAIFVPRITANWLLLVEVAVAMP